MIILEIGFDRFLNPAFGGDLRWRAGSVNRIFGVGLRAVTGSPYDPQR